MPRRSKNKFRNVFPVQQQRQDIFQNFILQQQQGGGGGGGGGGGTPAPSVTDPQSFSGTVGDYFSQTPASSNSIDSWSLVNGTTLPDGLSLNTFTGLISGTPADIGTTTINITASGPGGTSNTATITIQISVSYAVNFQGPRVKKIMYGNSIVKKFYR